MKVEPSLAALPRHPRPVRAHRLLRHRPEGPHPRRERHRPPGLQPHHDAARQLGEDAEERAQDELAGPGGSTPVTVPPRRTYDLWGGYAPRQLDSSREAAAPRGSALLRRKRWALVAGLGRRKRLDSARSRWGRTLRPRRCAVRPGDRLRGRRHLLSQRRRRTHLGVDQHARGTHRLLASVDSADPLRLYSLHHEGVQRSFDGGTTWELVETPFPPFFTLGAIAVDPHDPTFLLVAAPGGSTAAATAVTPGRLALHADHAYHSVAIDPAVAGRGFALSQFGGVQVSDDYGETWQDVNDGLPTDHYGSPQLAFDPGDPRQIFLLQYGSLYRSRDGGLSWSFVLSTDEPLCRRADRHLGIGAVRPAGRRTCGPVAAPCPASLPRCRRELARAPGSLPPPSPDLLLRPRGHGRRALGDEPLRLRAQRRSRRNVAGVEHRLARRKRRQFQPRQAESRATFRRRALERISPSRVRALARPRCDLATPPGLHYRARARLPWPTSWWTRTTPATISGCPSVPT